MIKIGDFARLSQVSIVTLRYYDEMCLLKPIAVDSFTGYRYYAVGQLPRLNRILALKDLGFSLEQIRQALADDLGPAHLRELLEQKRAEVERRVAEEQERLRRIEARLRQIEQEDAMPDYEVVLKVVPALRVASRRVTIPTNDRVPEYLSAAFNDVYEHLKRQEARVIGPCLTVWHTPADVDTNEEAEALVGIDRSAPSSELVTIYELPQARMASVVHHGDFADFTRAHAVLLTWIEANGYRVAGPFREIYIKHDHANLSDTTTEIQFPVEKV